MLACDKDEMDKAFTYFVGYVEFLIVADRSKQNHVFKQIMESTQRYRKVSNEETLT